MNTLSLLFAHCGGPLPPPIKGCVLNHPLVVSNLIWAVVVIALAFLAYCYLKKRVQIKKDMADADRKHELNMKEKAHEQEKFWYFQKELKKDYKKELNEKILKLEEEKKKLEEDLDKEKKDRNEALKKECLQAEHDFYEKILKTFYKTEESQQTNKQ